MMLTTQKMKNARRELVYRTVMNDLIQAKVLTPETFAAIQTATPNVKAHLGVDTYANPPAPTDPAPESFQDVDAGTDGSSE